MDSSDIYIFGAGTYGEVMFDLAVTCGYNPVGFFDDDLTKKGNFTMGIPVLGKLDLESFSVKNKKFIIAIGNNKTRCEKMDCLLRNNALLPSLIHPTAIISKYAKISEIGCYIHANTYLWTKVEMNKYSILSPCVMIAHHTILDEGTFVSAGSNIGAGIHIKKQAFVGIGSTIMTGIHNIGLQATIGAGSVVIKDVPDYAVIVGNPGKILKYNVIS